MGVGLNLRPKDYLQTKGLSLECLRCLDTNVPQPNRVGLGLCVATLSGTLCKLSALQGTQR